jgi:hypothetical protein
MDGILVEKKRELTSQGRGQELEDLLNVFILLSQ